MDNGISLRINKIINELFDGNKSEFARIAGISEASVRSYLQNTIPKADVLAKIATNIAISCEWLVLGVGDMLKSTSNKTFSIEDKLLAIIKDKDVEIQELSKTIGKLEERIDNLSKKSTAPMVVEDVECVDAAG